MSEERPKPAPAAATPPPRLERVPEGYQPPPVRATTGAGAPTPVPLRGAEEVRGNAPPPQRAGTSSYGMAAREVGADAAIAAGLAGQGSLAAESALHVFALAATMQATGRLTLTPEGRSYTLSFRRGTVEHAASTDPEDDLGRQLVARGAVGADALARAEAARAAAGGDLASALIAARVMSPADVAALLQEHGARIVQRALASEAGGWSWSPQAPPPPGAFPLGSPFAMLCAAVRALDVSALMRRLGDREHRAAARVGARVRIEDLRLTALEARVAGLFDGTRSPAELAAASPTDALVALRLAVLLGELQLLSFAAGRRPAPAPAPAKPSTSAPTAASNTPTAKPAGKPTATPRPIATGTATATATPTATARPAPAPSSGPARDAPAARPAAPAAPAAKPAAPAPQRPSLDRAALEALVARLDSADHFAVLGVKQDAQPAQIKLAYFQLAKSYHPDAVPTDAPPDVKKLCADVFAKVSEAWSVLSVDASRAAYAEELRGGATGDVDVGRIFEAEELFETGVMYVKARNYAEGLKKFDEAIALNADEAEFGMWKAWCEFVLAPDKRQRIGDSSAAIESGLARNPRCAQGYLFLGQMAKIVGDLGLAERQLRRGLAVAPDHADLKRELKYLRK